MSVLLLCGVEPLERWREAILQAMPDERIAVSEHEADPARIEILIADAPPRNLRRYTKLRLIQSLWMGIDGWLKHPDLPAQTPLARMLDPSMVTAMVETALAHILHVHLHHDDMRRQQSAGVWREFFNPLARERSVGLLGCGNLGAALAQALLGFGFQVKAWSRTQKRIEGVDWLGEPYALAAASDIVVCLLPLTQATQGIADARLFAAMRPQSVFINLGRGQHVVESDLLAALDLGRPRHAILDVFNHEPLPREHAFWRHPRVTVTPHSASMANVITASAFAAQNVRRLRAGQALLGLVNRAAGY